MSDQANEQGSATESPALALVTIFESRQYVDVIGRQVSHFTPTSKYLPSPVSSQQPEGAETANGFFRGRASVMMNTAQGPRPMAFDFQFPAQVKTLERAFVVFEETARLAIDEHMKRQAAAPVVGRSDGPSPGMFRKIGRD